MLIYQGIISRYALTFKDYAWINYDHQFRQKVALNDSLKWDGKDDRLYNEVLKGHGKDFQRAVKTDRGFSKGGREECYKWGKVGHFAKYCFANKLAPSARKFCFKWNSPAGCADTKCLFLHKCRVCGVGHPVFKCPSKVKR